MTPSCLIGDGERTQFGIITAWSEGLSNSIQVKGNVIRGVTGGGIYLTAAKAGKPPTVRLRGNVLDGAPNGIRPAGPFQNALLEDNRIAYTTGQGILVEKNVRAKQLSNNKLVQSSR